MEIFNWEYPWFKGNMHTHTSASDGALTPEEAIRDYWEKEYDFLVLTDHNKLLPESVYREMPVLRGVELAYNDNARHKAYHFIAVDPDEGIMDYPDPEFGKNPQAIIDHIRAHHGYCILAHPYWSLLSPEDMMKLSGYDAVEVMNSVSDPETRGDSAYALDVMMAQGRPMPMVASDDAHHYNGENGWAATWVNARSQSKADIMEALRAGRFYASEGPRFKALKVENGQIIVRSSPVHYIHFFSDAFSGLNRKVNCELNRNYACYNISPRDTYVRVQLTDFRGRRAWGPYINVQGLAR